MSDDDDSAVAKIGLVLIVLWCVTCVTSCQEIKYASSGKEATASITNITEEHNRYGGLTGYRIWYSFNNKNNNKDVTGYTIVGVDNVRKYDLGQHIEIQYSGGEMFTSRIKGTGSSVWVILLVISVAGTVGAVFWARAQK